MKKRLHTLMLEYSSKRNNYTTFYSKETVEEVSKFILETDQSRNIENLINYMSRVVKSDSKYETLILSMQTLIYVIEHTMPKVTNRQYESFFELYIQLDLKLKDGSITEENRRIIQCTKDISSFYYETWKKVRSSMYIDIQSFKYLSKLIDETTDYDALSKILSRQPYLSNICDENYNSIVYKIIQRYIQTKDPRYINFAIIFLECPSYILNESEINRIKREVRSKKNLELLNELLKHYFLPNENGSLKLKNGISSIGQCKVESPDRPVSSRRIVLTGLQTISLKRYSTKDNIGIDPIYTYSLSLNGDDIQIYYHIPDVLSIFEDNLVDEHAKYQMESFSYEDSNVYLGPKSSLNDAVFDSKNPKPAITFRITLDTSGEIKSLDVFESIIKVDRIYNSKIIGDKIKEGARELSAYAELAKLLGGDAEYTALESITEPLTKFLENSLINLGNNTPFIYRNVLRKNDYEYYSNRDMTLEITEQIWDKRKSKMYGSMIANNCAEATIYSVAPLKLPFKVTRSVRIIDPEISYVALENLRTIKHILIDKKGDDVLSKDRSMFLSMLASTLNRKYYVKNTEVRRVLQNY